MTTPPEGRSSADPSGDQVGDVADRGADPAAPAASLDVRARALKERVYASFTGLAIVASLALGVGHESAGEAFSTLAAGIVGIAAAGFVADVIAHQVTHAALPDRVEVQTLLLVAAGAVASASLPLLAIAVAWAGWVDLEVSLRVATGLYFVTLGTVALIATRRTGLGWRQQLVSLVVLGALALVVVLILLIAH